MTRTTLNLDPSVVRELRARSEREQASMGEVASQLLARALRSNEPEPSRRLEWVSGELGLPRVDLEDKEALHAALDDRL